MRPADYSSREYAVPFGRYEGARPNEYPANEVLVGRERQRARMMDWLLTMGSKGAYLVTGYRGVGKSSFVQFCLREYEDDVYGRYLNSRVGRRLLWDRIVAALALPASFALPLLAAHLLGGDMPEHWDLVDLLNWVPRSESPLRIAKFAVLAYFVVQPLVHAAVLIARASYNVQRSLELWLFFLAAAVVALRVPATTTAAYGCALLAVGNVASRAWSVLPQRGAKGLFGVDPSSAPLGDDHASLGLRKQTMKWLIIFSVPLTLFVIFQEFRPVIVGSDGAAVLAYLAPGMVMVVALAGLAISFGIHANDAQRISDHFSAPRSKAASKGAVAALRSARRVCAVAAVVVMIAVAVVYTQCSESLVLDAAKFMSLIIAVEGMLAVALRSQQMREKHVREGVAWFHFQPYPRFLLAVRAAYTLMFGIQLLLLAGVPLGRLHNGWIGKVLRAPFESWLSECVWVVFSAMFGIILLYFEEDWIARRHERNRRDDAYDVVRYADSADGAPVAKTSRMEQLHGARKFANGTLFWELFRVWLPTITVRVNLGFDNLSHNQVVKAMLMGLRDQYHRTFIAFRSPLAIGRRASRVFLAFIIAVGLGNPTAELLGGILPANAKLILRASHDISIAAPGGGTTVLHLTGCRVALFLAILLAFRLVRRRVGFSHHRSTYSRVNQLLESLTASIRVIRSSGGGSATIGSTGAGATAQVPSETFQSDTGPQDPRVIEQAFLALLYDVQDSLFGFPMAGQWLSLAAPQITFVFDELDKIGVSAPVGAPLGQAPPNYRMERERSRQMHRLFADMKNLLSTAPARFIFVGGRELHDEWLADRTSQLPLLSNVFDAEIYLPTLLVDSIVPPPTQSKKAAAARKGSPTDEALIGPGSPDDVPRPKGALYAYLNAQLAHANELSRLWHGKRRWTFGLFGSEGRDTEHFFVQEPDTTGLKAGVAKDDHCPELWLLYRTDRTKDERGASGDARDPLNHPVEWADGFFRQFALYLGFRSRGNPKRLNALIERFVRPTGRVVTDPKMRWSKFDCQHVLRFGHVQRSTIQLIANIQRRLDRIIGPRVEHQDDKIIRSALYLADYLLKFHRRAFSWANLERIDEMLHVHRAPDVRRVLSEMLAEWSECFINPIFEGMYDFRFRSEFAAEVRYISRRSATEMAAFNFTLDESQSLKTEYQTRLRNVGEKGEPIAEIHAALGELHDFDEEYEDARRHYLAAIVDLDAQTDRVAREKEGLSFASRIFDEELRPVRRHVDWGISRLRLMLQIGMTYERSRNYERAFVQYRDARTLSTVILFSLLDDYARGAPGVLPYSIHGKNRLETLKHLPLLYEPLFACAWAAEKAPTAIDSSLSLVEEAIWDLRCRLPFVRLSSFRRGEIVKNTPGAFLQANFAMVMTALHLSAGNLYFFKGCQAEQWLDKRAADGKSKAPPPPDANTLPRSDDESVDGYLLQAQYHYACALHDVRRFSSSRIRSARAKFVPPGAGGIGPLPWDLWPEFVLRRTAAALFCLADVWLARISVGRLQAAASAFASSTLTAKHFFGWLAGEDGDDELTALFGKESEIEFPAPSGRNVSTSGPPRRLIEFRIGAAESEWAKLERYWLLSDWGVQLLVLGGHCEEAAREKLLAAGNIETVLWSARAFSAYAKRGTTQAARQCAKEAVTKARLALEDALNLLSKARGAKVEPTTPTFAGRIACSLGLLAARSGDRADTRVLRELVIAHLGPAVPVGPSDDPPHDAAAEEILKSQANGFREALRQILERNAFSTLNHLHTLRTLVVDSATLALAGGATEEADMVDAHLDELCRLDGEYAAPLQFTPFHYGTAAVLWCESLRRCGGAQAGVSKRTDDCIEQVIADGRRSLVRSQQMYSSRQAYYEAISDLYYLDDDFNDRSIHVQHAVQMMGADLTRQLINVAKAR